MFRDGTSVDIKARGDGTQLHLIRFSEVGVQQIERRLVMKKLALGIAAATVLLSAAPAMAQVGFYAGHHGVGVEVGAPGPYYPEPSYDGCGQYGYGCSGYYDYYEGPSVDIGGGGGWHRGMHVHGHR
jgi:hypothetical protein